MADIRFHCRVCGQSLAIEDGAAGMEIRCPECGTSQIVPGPASAAEADPPADPAAPVDGEAPAPEFADRDTSASDTFRYEAFISYRHVEPDRTWARWLHTALETYRVPRELVRERGLPPRIRRVFRDEEELPASADLSREIERALDHSRFLIVVCSPRTPSSSWVNAEVQHFRNLGRHDRILALLVEGEPGESFPPSLREIRRRITDDSGLTRDEIQQVEPLAADVRPMRRERAAHIRWMAKLRMLACILGCPFDDLRRREKIRRDRQRAIAGVVTTALLALVVSLAVVAAKQWRTAGLKSREAIRQAERAEQARQEVQRQEALVKASEAAAAEAATKAAREEDAAQAANKQRAVADYARQLREAEDALEKRDFARAVQLLDECGPAERSWEWGYIHRRANRELWQAQYGRSTTFETCGAFGPEARWVAVGELEQNAFIRVYERLTGRELQAFRSPDPVEQLFAGADEDKLVAVSPRGAISVWDVRTGAALPGPPNGTDDRWCVASPDGRFLAHAGAGGESVGVWDVASGRPRMTFQGAAQTAAFSPDNSLLALAARDGTISLRRMADGRPFSALKRDSPQDRCHQLQFTPDGRWLWAIDDHLSVYDLARNVRIGAIKLPALAVGKRRLETTVAVRRDGRRLLCGDGDRVAMIEVPSGRQLFAFDHKQLRMVAFNRGGNRVLSSGLTGEMVVRDAADGSVLFTFQGLGQPLKDEAFSPDGTLVLSVEHAGRLHASDLSTNVPPQVFANSGQAEIETVGLTPGGHQLVMKAGRGDVSIWNTDTGRPWPSLPHCADLTLSPDSRMAALRNILEKSQGNEITVCEIPSGRRLASIRDTWSVTAMSISPDGRSLATAAYVAGGDGRSSTGKVALYDTRTGTTNWSTTWPHMVLQVNHTADGTMLLAGVQNVGGEFLDLRTNPPAPVAGFELPRDAAATAFSPDGRFLACLTGTQRSHSTETPLGASDIAVWSVPERKRLHIIQAPHHLKQLAFSPDSRRIVGCGESRNLLFWDAATGQEVYALPHASKVNCVAFDAEGLHLVAGCADGSAVLRKAARNRLLQRFAAENPATPLALSDGGGRVVICSGQQQDLAVWNVATGRKLRSLPPDSVRRPTPPPVALSRDGRFVAVARPSSVSVQDVDTGRELWNLPTSPESCEGVAFTGDGTRLVLARRSGISVVDARSGSVLLAIKPEKGRFIQPLIGPGGDGRTFYACDGILCSWDLFTGARTPWPAITNHFVHLQVGPDGKTATTTGDWQVRVLDLASGAVVKEVLSGGSFPRAVCDDQRLFMTEKNQLRIEDVKAPRLRLVLPMSSDVRSLVHGGPGVRTVAAGCADGTVWVWDVRATDEAPEATIEGAPTPTANGTGSRDEQGLVERLNSFDDALRRAAAREVASWKTPRWLPMLVESVVRHSDTWVACSLEDAMVAIGPPARTAAIGMLTNREDRVRCAAASCMVRWGDPETAGALAGILGDNGYVEDIAVEALKAIGPRGAPALLPAIEKGDRSAERAIEVLEAAPNPAIVLELLSMLKSDRRAAIESAATALGAMKAADAVPALSRLVLAEGTDDNARLAGVRALGRIGQPGAAVALRQVMNGAPTGTPSPPIRREAMIALGRIGDRTSLPDLMALLDKGEPDDQEAAAEAMGHFRNPNAVASLVRMLSSNAEKGDRLQEAAALALGRIGDPRAAPALLETLTTGQHSRDTRDRAAQALAMLRAKAAVGILLNMLQEGGRDAASEVEVVRALGVMGDPAACEPLAQYILKRSLHVDEALDALGLIDDPKAVHAIESVLHRLQPRELAHAARVLTARGQANLAIAHLQKIVDKESSYDAHRAAVVALRAIQPNQNPPGSIQTPGG